MPSFSLNRTLLRRMVTLVLLGSLTVVYIYLSGNFKNIFAAVDDSYTVSLLHFDGEDESTIFTDESGKIWTAYDGAQIDTSRSVFGGASGLFDGSGYYVTTPSSGDFDFGTGNWTVDFWLYINSATSYPGIVSGRPASGASGWSIGLGNYDDKIRIVYGGSEVLLSSVAVSESAWTHVALVRDTSTVTCYINGTSGGTWNVGEGPVNSDGIGLVLGRLGVDLNSYYLNGNIDELRISKDIARWTEDFTPPDTPYEPAPTSTPSETPLLTDTPMLVNCTGGNEELINGYRYHTFTTTGTLTCSSSKSVEVLVVAGGGGGGGHVGGGGGAGGVREVSEDITADTYTVTVGTGGNGGATQRQGDSGLDSIFNDITATGGGGGGALDGGGGKNGGSGGGGGGNSGAQGQGGNGNTPATTPEQGYGGGTGVQYSVGGGGGGASQAGENGSGGTPGKGGDGIFSSIASIPDYYGGGGAGGNGSANGGLGGGGASNTAGSANTGGGGGGGPASSSGKSGGSGIVIIKYLDSPDPTSTPTPTDTVEPTATDTLVPTDTVTPTPPQSHRSGLEYCSNHGGIALSVPYSISDWPECLTWCDTVMNGTDLPLCQFNGAPDECWVNHAPGYEEGVSDGDVNLCEWTGGNPPNGAWYIGFEPATTPTETPTPTPLPGLPFSDDFTDESISSFWNVTNGIWSETGGILSLTGYDDPFISEQKAVITGIDAGTDYTILAKVRVDSWADGDPARAGISVFSNPADYNRGYNLLFHNNHNTVQWLDDGLEWGPSYEFTWSNDTWYWFKIKVENGFLYGKVWVDGDSEPAEWTYSWERSGRTGFPALNGGSNIDGSYSSASFDDVYVSYNEAPTETPIPSETPTVTPTPQPTPDEHGNFQANLSSDFNADVFSFDSNRSDGNMDGIGQTYPADDLTNPITLGTIDFNLGPMDDGQNNAVNAVGQTVNLPFQTADVLYILASGAGDQADQTFFINYDTYSEEIALSISDWVSGPHYEEDIGIAFDHRHTPLEDDAVNIPKIYDYKILLGNAELRSITLPDNTSIKIFAMTLETELPIPTDTVEPTAIETPIPTDTVTPTIEPTPSVYINATSAELIAETATFNFTAVGTTGPYTIDLSISPDMGSGTYLTFGQGDDSPIVVNDPEVEWGAYICDQQLYWIVRSSDDPTVYSQIIPAIVDCSSGPTDTPMPTETVEPTATDTPIPTETTIPSPTPTADEYGNYQIDLSSKFTGDAFSFDSNPTDGNMNGFGDSYPADGLSEQVTIETIKYDLGPFADGQNNAFPSVGQTINLINQTAYSLDILAAAIGENQADSVFTVNYNGYSEDIALSVTYWLYAPAYGEDIAIAFDHVHTITGDNLGFRPNIYVYNILLGANPIQSITLADNPDIIMFALTMQMSAPASTNTPTPSPTETNIPIPTNTETPIPTNTTIPTNTVTPIVTNTPSPTNTGTPMPTNTNAATPTRTVTPSVTRTPTPTLPHSIIPTSTATPTFVVTTTLTPSPSLITSITPVLATPTEGPTDNTQTTTTVIHLIGPDGLDLINTQVTLNGVLYTTDGKGEFGVENIPDGTYELKVIIGDKEYTQSLVLGSTNNKQTVTVEFKGPVTSPAVYILAIGGGIILGGVLIYAFVTKKFIFSSRNRQE